MKMKVVAYQKKNLILMQALFSMSLSPSRKNILLSSYMIDTTFQAMFFKLPPKHNK